VPEEEFLLLLVGVPAAGTRRGEGEVHDAAAAALG
jgi:hypothetical protein